jgi:hypothetical protein
MAHEITNILFKKSLLEGGKLHGAMQYIADSKNELSLQIRDNYLNVYYRGGNILEIKSPKSFSFDENYFGKANKEKKEKTKELLNVFKEGDFRSYFEKAKKVMDEWFVRNPKPEREEQQKLILQNSYANKDSDFVIIDIEFAVSTESEYYYKTNKKGGHVGRNPRYDIIAIRKRDNILCVIELKKGIKSLAGKSGIVDHLNNFNDSIAENPQPFIQEIKELLKQKQEFGLIDKKLTISDDCKCPLFMFAYSYNSEEELNRFNKLNDEKCNSTPTILLPAGKLLLKE